MTVIDATPRLPAFDAVIVGGGSRSVANAIGSGSRVAYAVALDLVPELAVPAAGDRRLALAA
jgi:hypothetical protein